MAYDGRMEQPTIRITYDGQVVWTTAQAAQQLGMRLDSLRKAIQREGIRPMPVSLDGRTPLYSARDLAAKLRARPGRGSNLHPRLPRRARLSAETAAGSG